MSQPNYYGNEVVQFEIGSYENFIYLILDAETKTAAIVDPQKDLTQPLQVLKEKGFDLTSILLTHTHFDHTAGVVPLLSKYPKITVRAGDLDLHRLPKVVTSAPGFRTFTDQEVFQVGAMKVKAIHTPGHSAGAFSFYTAPYLFTGDTIFIRDCGRTDLDTGSNDEMFASIQKVKALPKETILLVGHHYAEEYVTTLEDELERSPPFQAKSVQELALLP